MLGGTVNAAEDSADTYASITGEQAFEILKSYGIVGDSLIENETINRKDCITAIMKIIGMTPEIAKQCDDKSVFNDVNDPYISVAHLECVAFGEDNGNYTMFYPDRNVTVKEAAAFIARCLEPLGDLDDEINAVDASTDDTLVKAKTVGIIQKTDVFYENGDVTLTPGEFCTMLYRMLYQPRYRSCDSLNSYTIYPPGSGRYIDYLTKIEQ